MHQKVRTEGKELAGWDLLGACTDRRLPALNVLEQLVYDGWLLCGLADPRHSWEPEVRSAGVPCLLPACVMYAGQPGSSSAGAPSPPPKPRTEPPAPVQSPPAPPPPAPPAPPPSYSSLYNHTCHLGPLSRWSVINASSPELPYMNLQLVSGKFGRRHSNATGPPLHAPAPGPPGISHASTAPSTDSSSSTASSTNATVNSTTAGGNDTESGQPGSFRHSHLLPALGARASGSLSAPGIEQQLEDALPYAQRAHPSGAATKDRLAVGAVWRLVLVGIMGACGCLLREASD